ncbi:hypothetical protein R83H12_00494 [Fibrobacteria bacterium R8-3-H12]
MDEIVKLSDAERLELFQQTSSKLNIPAAMVEKDFWTCWILWKLFNDSEIKEVLRFKGGTSLSKCYNLIERFSEDLDIVLAKELVLGEDALFKPSYTKQRKFLDELSERSAQYTRTILKNKISKILGNSVKVYTDDEYAKINLGHKQEKIDNNNLHIIYPKATRDSYLRPDILLEIGIISAWTPNEPKEVQPYISKAYPNIKIASAVVPTIKAKRTFWDKATILHREYYRSNDTHTPERYSRHYYDLYKIGLSPVKDEALADFDLLAEVVDFKDKFYHCPWAKYKEVLSGGLHLLPNDKNRKQLAQDYKAMRGMIFGNIPDWNEILDFLQELENETNQKARTK